MCFDILNRLSADHECDGRTDGQTEGHTESPFAIQIVTVKNETKQQRTYHVSQKNCAILVFAVTSLNQCLFFYNFWQAITYLSKFSIINVFHILHKVESGLSFNSTARQHGVCAQRSNCFVTRRQTSS